MLLQRFQLIDHKHYQLKLKQTLTLKPDGFTIQVKPRPDLGRSSVAASAPAATRPAEPAVEPTPAVAGPAHHTPLLVLYGSNLGTCQDLATRIAEDGRARGFTSAAGPLDDYVKQLPTQGAVVIVTSSYNGTPPDNAVNFCHWLQDANLAADALQGVNYTVFGCGNREWAATFQAVPRLLDSALAQHGAKRIYPRGEGDAAGDFDSAFQAWYQPLWKGLAEALSLDVDGSAPADLQQLYAVELLTEEQAANPVAASIGARVMRILQERELQTKDGPHPSERSTRHVEVALPTGVNYTTGDHLGVLARNTESQIRRVLARFSFDQETRIRLHKNDTRTTPLPINEPIRVFDLLSEYVEVQEVATRTHIKRLLEYLPESAAKQQLAALAGDDEASTATYRQEVLAKRKSLIDLLEEFPDCALPFNVYLELLSPLRPRYYSISSSPLVEPDRCSITVGVVQGPAKSGHGTFEGVCSTYLSHREPSESVYAFVQDTKSRFRPPEDVRTPMIMIGPGTGLAPFRGFLQERAALKAQGQPVGKALLFFGCRHPQQDFIYEDELEAFVKQGITKLSVAFSRLNGQKTYVQDNIKEDKEEVWQLLQEGAIVYICGDGSKMAPDVRKTFASIYQEKMGASEQEADQWLNELTTQNRYLVDVWGV
jgi:cytochrome P450/NADPH-cytochrome P450 reductase